MASQFNESVGFSPLSVLAALYKIVEQADLNNGAWNTYLNTIFSKESHRGMLESIEDYCSMQEENGEEEHLGFLKNLPNRVQIGQAFLKVCGSRNVKQINKFLAGTGIQMSESTEPNAQSIYSASRLHINWEWPLAIKARAVNDRLSNEPSYDGAFMFEGSSGVCWPAKLLGSSRFNAVVIEVPTYGRGVIHDLTVTYLIPTPPYVSLWKQAGDNTVVQRRILTRIMLEARLNAKHDPFEEEAYLKIAYVPNTKITFRCKTLEEFARLSLPNGYFISETAQFTKLEMNEKGGSVESAVGFRADRGIVFRDPNLEEVSLDFREVPHGYICIIESSAKGIPDPNLGGVLVAWLFSD